MLSLVTGDRVVQKHSGRQGTVVAYLRLTNRYLIRWDDEMHEYLGTPIEELEKRNL